ncbi:MAG TPA: PLP-dependent aminotransferase family protein [Lachnospiraceae bacterium]
MYEFSMTLGDKENLYEQIYKYIKGEMLEGTLKPGERLPSTRVLSQSLGVSRSTVDLAYQQLLSEGYISSIPAKGYFVSDMEIFAYAGGEKEEILLEKEEAQKKPVVDFSLTKIDEDGFPHSYWKKISKKILDIEDENLYDLGDCRGELSLRKSITDYLHRFRQVNCHPNQIVIGAGNDYLAMLLSVLLREEKYMAMENPTYKSAADTFVCMGLQVQGIAMDESGMDIDTLMKSEAKVAYVMPSHQFPMGCVMPIKRRIELLDWAKRKNGYIIEDDYDSQFRYRGKPIPALQGLDDQERVIYLGTFSKSIAPAIRFSYMVLPKSLLERWNAIRESFSVTISKVDQKIIEEFLSSGWYERHVNKMRNKYRQKRNLVLGAMKEWNFPYSVSGEEAGLHFVLHLPFIKSKKDLLFTLKEAGIILYAPEEYLLSSKTYNEEDFLLGYASLREKEIGEQIADLGKKIEAFY